MSDPRVAAVFDMTPYGPKPRSANLSPLMQARSRASQGEKVNFCPHGCAVHQLDENGYCRHLVGFTSDGKTYEPMFRRKGKRVVQVERELVEAGIDDAGEKEYEYGPPQLPAVQKGDVLVQITVSSRVYRDVDAAAAAKKAS